MLRGCGMCYSASVRGFGAVSSVICCSFLGTHKRFLVWGKVPDYAFSADFQPR
jgi:hypothetical protein